MKRLAVIIAAGVLLVGSGCTTNRTVTSGAQDSRPLLFDGEYQSVDVAPVNDECKAIFGIPLTTKIEREYRANRGKGNPRAVAVYFNGVRLNAQGRFLPIVSLVGLTAAIGYGMHAAAGFETIAPSGGSYVNGVFQPNTEFTKEAKLPLGVGMLIAFPVAGGLNNFLFKNSAASRAYIWSNHRMITAAPNADLFYYPKYEWTTDYSGLWFQKSTFQMKAKASVLRKQTD